ncbi:uncharacterized protein TA18460 [Theileria annulata]|uniref:Uncharacterized protein n=1 Tax=Theileria annulata TaxID=5874 RepID=Q4UAW3_THEAN|nr:uncharacterized protein TA18460 [Theileria annulata]CAI76038.1 hypothetical protein TA18460 [Theileria annulata]|eukprot:XP_955514.1 hypothetical protein TA18460 [Theileria annulata]
MNNSDDLLEVIDITDDIKDVHEQNDIILSESEQLIYDRQIRLWGIKAQKIIMNSRILFIGKNGILEESMKNLLLSGMNITFVNNHIITEQDIKLSFFLKNDDIGLSHSINLCKRMSSITFNEKRINGINLQPLIEENGQYKFIDPKFLHTFHVLCISTTDYPLHKLVRLNEECREMGIAFFATLSCGIYGYFFTDLNKHKVLEMMNKKEQIIIEYRNLSSVLTNPQFPKNCEPNLRCLISLITLIQQNLTFNKQQNMNNQQENLTTELNNEQENLNKRGNINFTNEQLELISKQYNSNINTIKEMIKMYGIEFPITSSILGGYLGNKIIILIFLLALEIRKFVTKQHETIPNFCLFDMLNSSIMLSIKYLYILLLILFNVSSTNIFNRNVQYLHIPLKSQFFNKKSNLELQKILFINIRNKLINNKLYNFDKDFEIKLEELYNGLKEKKWSFSDLQKQLIDEGITLDGCNKPDDVIRRVAKLSLLGKEKLERQLEDNNPEFQLEFNNILSKIKSEYNSIPKKKNFINSLIKLLQQYNINIPKNYIDDDIINLISRIQSKYKLQYKLPKCNNFGIKTIEGYKSEVNSIFNIYNKIKHDDYLKNNLLDDIKNELIMLNVDFEDCKTDEDLINRLSYSRIFPKQTNQSNDQSNNQSNAHSNGNKNNLSNKFVRRKFGRNLRNPLDTIFQFHTQDFNNLSNYFQNLFNQDNEFSNINGFNQENELENENSDLDMENLGNTLFNNIEEDMLDGMNFNGFSIFKDLISMFGNPNFSNFNSNSKLQFNKSNLKSDNSKIQFDDSKFVDNKFVDSKFDSEMKFKDEEINYIETDPSLILLQQKTKETGDFKLQNILNKAIQDPNLRDVLKIAITKGYEEAKNNCNGNVKALYILEKLNDKHLWS